MLVKSPALHGNILLNLSQSAFTRERRLYTREMHFPDIRSMMLYAWPSAREEPKTVEYIHDSRHLIRFYIYLSTLAHVSFTDLHNLIASQKCEIHPGFPIPVMCLLWHPSLLLSSSRLRRAESTQVIDTQITGAQVNCNHTNGTQAGQEESSTLAL